MKKKKEKPQDTPSMKSMGNQQSPVNSTLPAVLGSPMQCNLRDGETPGKNPFQHCQNSQPKKQEFRFGPKEDLLRFLSMNYKRGPHGKLIMGCQQHTDDMELPNLNQCQKTEQRGKIRQDRKSLDEQNVLQALESSAPQPSKPRDVSPPMDTANASVSRTYDAQKKSELVSQKGTEATSQVSQLIKRSTNLNFLHGIPDSQSLMSPQNATEDKKRNSEDLIRRKDEELFLPINLECPGHLSRQLYSLSLVRAVHHHQDGDRGHPDATEATSQQRILDPQPLTLPSEAMED